MIDALVTSAGERIDEALADGRIDEAEATERRAAAVDRITDVVENGLPDRGDGIGHGRGDDDDADAADEPDATATPEATDSTTATTDGGS